MDKKIFVFLGFFVVSLFILLALISVSNDVLSPGLKVLLLLLAFILNGLAYSTRYYLYLLMPILKQRSRNITISNEDAYYLSTAQDAIIHKEGDDFIATMYVKIPLYGSATEMTPEEKLDFTRQIARAVSLSNDPVRFTSQLHILNKDNYIESLRGTISSVENEESKVFTGTITGPEAERIKGKSSMWHKMLDNIGKTSSLELVSYASVSALGTKEFEAVSIVQQRARELMSGISAVFGVTPSVMTGEGILKFVEPEYLIPYSTVSEQISKAMQEQVS